LLAEKHDVPLIAFHAILRGGAVQDSASKEGTAALTGGLLRKGAGKRNAQEIAALVDGLGGVLGTGAGLEGSFASGEFMAKDQVVMLDLLADVLRRPTFPEQEFEKLKAQSIDEITSEKDDPGNVIGEYAYSFVYGAHPYARPVGGDEETLKRLTRGDVLSYYRANYGGDRLLICMVGDFSIAAMESRIRARFSDWPKAPAAPPSPPAPARPAGRRVLLIDKPDATQTYFWIGTLGVSRLDPDRVALDVANTAYGGRFTSILNNALRIEGGLTYGARWQAPRFTQSGTVAIYSYSKTESTVKAIDVALGTLAAVRRSGIDPATVASTKSYMEGQFPPRLETEDQIAGAIADLAFYGQERRELEEYTSRVEATRDEDVKRVIQRVYPSGEDLTFVLVGNAARIRAAVGKYGPVTELKITDPLLSGLRKGAR
ncbi:MAG TPA: pitrilysin family protein, partial [Candidatus Limnocylindrales bacterium]|nr:pitrilysin family protein [Candidatus Limnocylindrales bacterium]